MLIFTFLQVGLVHIVYNTLSKTNFLNFEWEKLIGKVLLEPFPNSTSRSQFHENLHNYFDDTVPMDTVKVSSRNV